MNTPLYAACLVAGITATMSGLKGIETENIYRGILFLVGGTLLAGFLFSLVVSHNIPRNADAVTVLFVVVVTAFGSGLTVLFIDSENKTQQSEPAEQ
ncbi:hypothetical protein [Haloarcula litorea]|uniref:hypothetical protein n=1 Tax=Haloarcula litorea TaxID=3032579 RepID=UPI0023E8E7F1|nr:hypothetical protein [Halomicroarcula sp. GDY20]